FCGAQFLELRPASPGDRGHQLPADPRLAGAPQHRRAVSIEFRGVQMAVAVVEPAHSRRACPSMTRSCPVWSAGGATGGSCRFQLASTRVARAVTISSRNGTGSKGQSQLISISTRVILNRVG